MGPLENLRIIEMAQLFNGPVTASMLGDLGAEVIKIETPVSGDLSRGTSSMFDMPMVLHGGFNVSFEAANRSKKSVVLNLHLEEGREIFYKLIERSDVFITNHTSSVLNRLKVDYDTLTRYNPKLIYAQTSTYGNNGPLSNRRGYDIMAQAVSGAVWIFGDRDSPEPSIAVGSIFDQVAATSLAYGILAALVARERTGVGQQVECSLMSSAIHMQGTNINTFLWQGKGMSRFSHKRARNPLVNYYKCADGKWILLCEAQSAKYWHDFCCAMGIEELEDDSQYNTAEARRQSYAEFIDILDRRFVLKTRDEWLRIFSNYDFGYAPIYDYAEMVVDPQVLINKCIIEMDHPTLGKLRTVGSPVQFDKTPVTIQSAAPQFGQHTEEVLIEILGYSWEDIGIFREHGTLG